MTSALVSRQASPSSAPVAMQQQTDALMVRAKHVAAQGDMIPKRYQNNLGACMMLIDWADKNGVSMIDAIGHVAFVYGKPVVEARLQKRMARERGYGTKLLEKTDDHATVVVIGRDGEQIGEPVTYTWQMAQDYGIHLENKKLGTWKAAWKADRSHMLVLRATTRALDYYGDGIIGDTDEDLEASTVDPVEPPDEVQQVDMPEPAQETLTGVVVPSEDELKAALKAKNISQGAALRFLAETVDVDVDVSTLAKVAANPDAALDLADWIDQQ